MDEDHKNQAKVGFLAVTEQNNLQVYLKKLQRRNAFLRVACAVLLVAFIVMVALFIWQVCKNTKSQTPAATAQLEMPLEDETDSPFSCPILPQSLPMAVLPQNVHFAMMKMKKDIESIAEKLPLSAISMNILYRERVIWSTHHGVRSQTRSMNPNDHTIYRVGSVSKVVVALMVFKFVENGWIKCLDDPLEVYIPLFSVMNPFNKHKITIRQILSHTSGLPREPPCGIQWSTNDTFICPVSTETVLHEVSKMALKFAPGTDVAYSNLGYSLLARTLSESLTRTTFEVWVQDNILKPLGMSRSGYNLKSSTPFRVKAYRSDREEFRLLDWGWASPSFQLHSTIGDLTKLMKMFLKRSERILKSETLLRMFRQEFAFPDGLTMFGAPWEITRMSYRVFSKTGYVPGYSAVIALVPDLQLGVNVLMTGQNFAPRLADISLRFLIPAFKTSLRKYQSEPHAPSNARMYTGTYLLQSKWLTSSTYHVNITLKKDMLWFDQSEGTPKTAYLRVRESLLLQLVYPSGLSCQHYGLLQNYETLRFEFPNEDGISEKFNFGPFVFFRKVKR